MLDLEKIRERIQSRYDDLGLSVTGIWHKQYGVGQTTIRNFLDGMTQSLTLETVIKLQEPLKTTAEWLLFGERSAPSPVSEARLRGMVDDALSEIQPGMSLAEIRPLVASNLHGQLERVLSGQVSDNPEDAETVPDIAFQSDAPTKPVARAAGRKS